MAEFEGKVTGIEYPTIEQLARLDDSTARAYLFTNIENLRRLYNAIQLKNTTYTLTTGKRMVIRYRKGRKIFVQPEKGYTPCGEFELEDFVMLGAPDA